MNRSSYRLCGLAAAFCLVFAFIPATGARQVQYLKCDNLESCVALVLREDECAPSCDILMVPEPYHKLPGQFQEFGRPAVDALLPLLQHRHSTVRSKAAFILSASNFLEERDYEAIIRAYHDGNGWLTRAVGRIARGDQISSVISEGLTKPGEEFGQVLEAMGPRAEPLLAEALDCSKPSECESVIDALLRSLNFISFQSPTLAKRSFDAAENRNVSTQARRRAVGLAVKFSSTSSNRRDGRKPEDWVLKRLGSIGKDADRSVGDVANSFLIEFKDTSAVDAAIRMLDSAQGFDKQVKVWKIGAMGSVAASAGPKLRGLLNDPDWDVRVAAAEALGKIGDREAVPQLITSIDSADWLLALRAVEALGTLNTAETKNALVSVSTSYWHPAVREAARSATMGKAFWNQDSPPAFTNPIAFYCSEEVEKPSLPANLKNLDEDKRIDIINTFNQELLNDDIHKFINTPALRGAVKPPMTLTYDGWTFVGTDKGEFGGDLSATSSSRKLKVIDDNVTGLFVIDGSLFAATGLNHMGLMRGFFWRITFAANGSPSAELIMRMTGAPQGILVAPNGTIGVYGSSGNMLVHADGQPEWLSCPAKSYYPRDGD
jgi:HEAT repeats